MCWSEEFRVKSVALYFYFLRLELVGKFRSSRGHDRIDLRFAFNVHPNINIVISDFHNLSTSDDNTRLSHYLRMVDNLNIMPGYVKTPTSSYHISLLSTNISPLNLQLPRRPR